MNNDLQTWKVGLQVDLLKSDKDFHLQRITEFLALVNKHLRYPVPLPVSVPKCILVVKRHALAVFLLALAILDILYLFFYFAMMAV